MKGLLFLSNQGSHLTPVCMVIGIDNPHIHIGKHTPYVEGCGPQGPIFKYKLPAFSYQPEAVTWLWLSMVIGIDHFYIHNNNMRHLFKGCGPQGTYISIKGPAFS